FKLQAFSFQFIQRDPAQAGAEIRERDDLELDLLVVGERVVVERLLFLHHRGTEHTEDAKREEVEIAGQNLRALRAFVVNSCLGRPADKISSLRNPRVKQLVKLRDRRPRDEAGVFLIEGYREIRRALEKKVPLRELYFSPDWFLGENEPALLAQAQSAGARLFALSKAAFAKVAYRERPDGLLAVAPQWRRTLDELAVALAEHGRDPFLLVVEAIEKPGNL